MLKRAWLSLCFMMLAIVLISCTTETAQPLRTGSFQEVTGRDLRIVTGQRLYVPAYSQVLLNGRGLSHDLVVTLAVHNTDLDAPIIIETVRYYDTDGNIVRDYIDEPIELSPLATTGFLVDAQDSSGGWGSNFIVEWVAEEPVYEPVIEAVMVSRTGTQGISMISLGRVLSQNNVPASEQETNEADE